MKVSLKFFLIGLAGILSVAAFNARADLEVSAAVSVHATADFYAPLAPSGAWIEVGSYGRCWRPAGVAVEWRPTTQSIAGPYQPGSHAAGLAGQTTGSDSQRAGPD